MDHRKSPCESCRRMHAGKCNDMCSEWRAWFGREWENIRRGGARMIEEREAAAASEGEESYGEEG